MTLAPSAWGLAAQPRGPCQMAAGWDIQDGHPGWVVAAIKGAMPLPPCNHLPLVWGGGELVMGLHPAKHGPGSPSTVSGSCHQALPCREVRAWLRVEHLQLTPVILSEWHVPTQIPPHLSPPVMSRTRKAENAKIQRSLPRGLETRKRKIAQGSMSTSSVTVSRKQECV